jgi:hypothetical protein
MREPFVSVLMCVYNGEQFLSEAVDSILAQSFSNFEFIIVNDGSTDNTINILDKYQEEAPRIKVYHQENRGLTASLNTGIGLAKGKYIARMDADDIALIDRLLQQVHFMEAHPEVAVVGGNVDIINVTGSTMGVFNFPPNDHDIKTKLLLGDCPICHPTVFLRTEALRSIGGYRRSVVDAEDYDLWLRMADRFQLANLPGSAVLKYRRHPGQVSVHKCRQQALSNLAARTAAVLRKNNHQDPLDLIETVTPSILTKLGLSEADQKAAVSWGYVTRIRSMVNADELAIANNALTDLLRSDDWKYAKNWMVADLQLLAARLYWRQRQAVKSIFNVGLALTTRPIILIRPLKPLLQKLGLPRT